MGVSVVGRLFFGLGVELLRRTKTDSSASLRNDDKKGNCKCNCKCNCKDKYGDPSLRSG